MERVGREPAACEQPLILPSNLSAVQGATVCIRENRAQRRYLPLRLLPICQISGYAGRQGNGAPGVIRFRGRKLAAGIPLGMAHIQNTIRQVDIAPMQGGQLPDTQAGCQRQPDTHSMRCPLAGLYQLSLLGRGEALCLRLGFGRQIGKMRRVARDHPLPDRLMQRAVQHAVNPVQAARREPLPQSLASSQVCNQQRSKIDSPGGGACPVLVGVSGMVAVRRNAKASSAWQK